MENQLIPIKSNNTRLILDFMVFFSFTNIGYYSTGHTDYVFHYFNLRLNNKSLKLRQV